MQYSAPDWVVPVMRTGYAARAFTYALVGGLAVWAAWIGGRAEGTKGALQQLQAAPWGTPVLVVVALGLACYAVWRFTDAALDLDAQGKDAKGYVARAGQTVTGLIHLALGFGALRMAFGGQDSSQGSGSGGGTETATKTLMELPYGPYLVMIAGAITIGAGGYYIHKAVTESYKKRMLSTSTTERLDPALKAGLIAHGIVVGIIGAFILFAGIRGNSGQAGGIGQTFETVRSAPFGQALLFVLATGLVMFGLFCLIQAIYRVIPRHSEADAQTMAGDLADQIRAKLG